MHQLNIHAAGKGRVRLKRRAEAQERRIRHGGAEQHRVRIAHRHAAQGNCFAVRQSQRLRGTYSRTPHVRRDRRHAPARRV